MNNLPNFQSELISYFNSSFFHIQRVIF